MALKCRHVMPGGGQCHGYAIHGANLCYFHRRRRIDAKKPVNLADPIEIPLLEDRCAIQVTLSAVLRQIANNTIDRPRASLLLYGLQLSLQSVDRKHYSIPFGSVQALSRTRDGEEIVADLDDEYDDEDEEEEDDESEESEDNDSEGDATVASDVTGQPGGDAEADQNKSASQSMASSSQDKSASESKASSNSKEKAAADDDSGGQDDENSGDHSEEEKVENEKHNSEDDEFAGKTIEELIAGQTYLQSVSNALDVGDMRLAMRLLSNTSP